MWIDDDIIASCAKAVTYHSWIPEKALVVLGRSNKGERECQLELCRKDQVPVLRRYGGGGAVVLHPESVILSLGTWVHHPYRNDYYFSMLNKLVIECLACSWPKFSGIKTAGISDLAIGDKKIAGTSLFRSRNYLLYQISILVGDNVGLMERYLKHPSKEPQYRQGKSHREFVSCLKNYYSSIKCQEVKENLDKNFLSLFYQKFENEISQPQEGHICHLKKKISPYVASPLPSAQQQNLP